jgi:hypothetical protein
MEFEKNGGRPLFASLTILLILTFTIFSAQKITGLNDTTPPSITGVNWNPRYPGVSDTITVSARVTDESGIAWVKLTYCIGEACYAVDMSGSSGLYIGGMGPFSEGQIKFSILASDTVGNIRESPEYSITIDGTKPSVRILSPNGGEILSKIIIITWSVYDNFDSSPSITIDYSSNNGNSWEKIQQMSGSGGEYEWNTTSLEEGSDYLVRVEAQDKAGNRGSDKSDTSFTIDNTPPHTGHLIEGEIGENNWYISPVIITFTPYDNLSGINNTIYTINNETQMQYTNPFTIEDSGEYHLEYYSTDNAGNKENHQTLQFRINREKPIVSLENPKKGYLYIGGREISIIPLDITIIIGDISVKATASDETSNVTKVEFYVDDELKHTTTEQPYEWLWSETIYLIHLLKVKAYNESGNSETAELRLLIFNIHNH